MSKIQEYLDKIKVAVYGRDVRDSIHDSIEQCYTDVTNGKTLADNAASLANTAASSATEKATLAEQKAAAAESAAAKANASADSATAAAGSAKEKASLADTAAATAEEAADNALTAAQAASEVAETATSVIAETRSAKEAADNATRDAISAKDAANAAASNVNTAITSVNTAVSSANAAASNANMKADQANTAAINANEKAGIATVSASNADTAAANAQTAKEGADKAAKNANDKASLADTARLSADAAATSATTAASNANAAASNATTAANTAELAVADCTTATYNANVASASADKAAKRADSASVLIEQMTITSENVGPDALSEANLTEINNHYNIHFRLKQGQTGAPFIVKGSAFSSVEELESNIGSPAVGDQYNVGVQPPYDIYRWTGAQWENQGPIGIRIDSISTSEIDTVVNGESVSTTANKYLGLAGFIHFFSNKLKPLLAGKVDKIDGKGLSSNDFTDSHKDTISSLEDSVLALKNTKVDKLSGKGLSTNDFTSVYKNQVDQNKNSIEQLTGSVVLHTAQTLTEAQQTQARSNIGVEYGEDSPAALGEASPGTSPDFARSDHVHPIPSPTQMGAVQYTGTQSLSESQKTQARVNIGAGKADDMVKTVDGETPYVEGDVHIFAVRYKSQSLSASEQAQARTNIGAASSAKYTATLSTGSWSSSAPYTQTVNISGILATDEPFVDVSLSSASTTSAATGLLGAWGLVGRITADAGKITAYCYEKKPTVNIPIILKVVR